MTKWHRLGTHRAFVPPLLAFCLFISASRAEQPTDRFDGHHAWMADSILSTPAFDGRRGGSDGGRIAEEWIASQFAAAGLRPGSKEGTYFQGFPVIGFRETKTSLELLDGPFGKVRFLHGDDYNLLLTPGAGNVTAEAVFVGYGIDAPEKGRDDYQGCDLDGKIAIIIRGQPDDGQDWGEEYSRNHTFPAARRHGARAVLYYQRERPVAGAALSTSAYDPDTPAGYIAERVVTLLLRETGHRLDELKEKLKDGPFPLPTGKRLRFKVSTDGESVSEARNVLGLLRGSDPLLGSEVVIVGAHHDHIGFDADKRLYGGANDNASGTSVVLELARAFQEAEWTPRRSVLFVTFGGEEMGLLGSKHLAANLPFDSSRVVAMINLDMVGQGEEGFGIAGGARLGKPYISWRTSLDTTLAKGFEEYRLKSNNSDHGPFADHGVPAATSWSRGDHHSYHDFEDRARYVSPEILETVGRGVGSLLVVLADYPEPLADGHGWERTLRAEGTQIAFDPIASADLIDPDRNRLDGDGRLSARLVKLDEGDPTGASTLRRLGRLLDLPTDRPWLRIAETLSDVSEAHNEMGMALLPVVGTATLEQLGWEATQAICAAGLAGVTLSSDSPSPTPETTAALGRFGRILIADAASDWRRLLDREDGLSILVRTDADAALPSAPDSAHAGRAMLVLTVAGKMDSTRIRQALGTWGEEHLHLDLSQGLEKGVADRESFDFIAWLRQTEWEHDAIRALLGGNIQGLGDE